MSIRVKIRTNERTNTVYYKDFKIEDEMTEDKNVEYLPIQIDIEQGKDEIWDYDYYEKHTFNEESFNYDLEEGDDPEREDYISMEYVAIEKEEDLETFINNI